MPFPTLRRKKAPEPEAAPRRTAIAPDDLALHDHSLRLQFHALSSDGIRLRADPEARRRLPTMLEGFARSPVEQIEPVTVDLQDARPSIIRPAGAERWIEAHRHRSPIVRHALYVLESLDAIDLAYENFAVTLLHGDVDGEGFPRFDAIVGGPVTFWDETTGDLIVRIVLAWGGEGVRGDTERMAQRLVARLMTNLLATQGDAELARAERPVAVASAEMAACSHCGFTQIDRRAFYCPKCGMRLERGA